jgi:hypothetical protein
VAEKYLSTLGIGDDEDQLHRSFRRGEDMRGLVRLLVCGYKSHVPGRDLDEGWHVVVTSKCGGVPRCVIPDREDQDHQEKVVVDFEKASA